jgi:hypothetical protein
MFAKGRPIRIYRAPTCRGVRESPPYFTPTRLPSIRRTISDVLGRNRFENPVPTEEEISAATEYVGAIAGLPNPFVGLDGTFPESIELPGGGRGRPAPGARIFEGKGGCANVRCHPAPVFTADQSSATRGFLHQTGTPIALSLRPELQDLAKNYGQPPPSLTGVWDQFPLYLSGAGGNEVLPNGTIAATDLFPLRASVLQRHGGTAELDPWMVDDLLAYLLTL